jgi:cysteine desulfuration protein SufE
MDDIQNEIIAECSALKDRIEMYEYLLTWGDKLAPMDERYKIERHSVAGCQSSTWIWIEYHNGLIHCYADSDTRITKGMIALILRVINDRDPRAILQNDLFFIDRIGLRSNLSPARSHGLNSVLRLIRDQIEEHIPHH